MVKVMRTKIPAKRLRRSIPALLALCIAYGLPASAAHGGDTASVASSNSAPNPGSRITTSGLDSNEAFSTSQAAVGTTPHDYTLLDREGMPRQLSSYRGKPLLVSFIYTGCFHICPAGTRALHKSVRALHRRFGDRQFNVVTIGFNQPEDSPEALDAYARQQHISEENWRFLSPDRTDVAALSRDFGFAFAATPAGFDHTLQVSVLDAQGEIYRQVYGDSFTAEKIGEPLRQLLTGARLVEGEVGLADLIDRVRILCSVYDPETGTYRADYTLYFMIAGGVTFFVAMLWFMLSELRARMLPRRAKGST
jgi:protein SCO1/2